MLKNFLGNSSRDPETVEEMRAALRDMQQERARLESVIRNVQDSTGRLEQLGEPIAKAGSDVNGVLARLGELEARFQAMEQIAARVEGIAAHTQSLTERHEQAHQAIATTLEETQQVRAVFDELSQKVDLAEGLRERLNAFLEVEKPFQQVLNDTESVRSQVDGASEALTRLREQNERLMDAHKLAMSKMEALDRRRDDLGRSMQDKERRVASVEQAVKGMDGIQHMVEDARREIGTLKSLAETVVQKTAALEAQREMVEHALAQADHLDRAMRRIDAGVRQGQENEKLLGTMQEHASALRTMHESVLERSAEITQLQREAEEQARGTRQDLSTMTDEMKRTVERFEFESRGLESASQRVSDLRAAVSDAENRFKPLGDAVQSMNELRNHTQTLAGRLQALGAEVGQVDGEMATFLALRRDLENMVRTARDHGERLTRVEESRPLLDRALADLEQLGTARAAVSDATETTKQAHVELGRAREQHAKTREWLGAVEQSLIELRDQATLLHAMAPSMEAVQRQAERLGESLAAIEARRATLEDLQSRLQDLGGLSAGLDERGLQLATRMDAAEQRFVGLAANSDEAERLARTMTEVVSHVNEAGARVQHLLASVTSVASRCESVESLAEETRALKPELEQRQRALNDAAKDLKKASGLRQEAAAAAQKLDQLAKALANEVAVAEKRVTDTTDLAIRLEDRAAGMQHVEKRLDEFETRLATWEPVEKEIGRSLEQIVARQGTVEALRADLDRMFAVAESTSNDVRTITSAHQELESSRTLLDDVKTRLASVEQAASSLDERKRQLAKAEERLARAEALLVDVRSSVEALQGQKAIVDQAVEKTGSLQFLLKQADAAISGLREEQEMAHRVRTAVAVGREDEDDDVEARAA